MHRKNTVKACPDAWLREVPARTAVASKMTRLDVAKPELGTKRIDPETGRKFYDLNRDPIVSPYTGQSYPRSYFETSVDPLEEEDEEAEGVDIAVDSPEFISLEDADGDVKDDDLPDLDDDVELDDDGDDTFLEEEDDEDDMTGLIGGSVNDDDDES